MILPLRAAVLSAILLCPAFAYAPSVNADVQMQAVITDAGWRFRGSRDKCTITQDIPNFGEATFISRPKDSLGFVLNAVRPLASTGAFKVVEVAPPWHPQALKQNALGTGKSMQGNKLWINSPLSDRMLMSLYQGFEPQFSRITWYDTQAQVDVALRSLHFREVYEQFLGCQSALLIDRFAELERSSLKFVINRWDILASAKPHLERLAAFLKDDKNIRAVFIDGHTDNSGDEKRNLELSQKRAENIGKFLADAGVDEALITVRYHGGRYPIAPNETKPGRIANRRTTIRLERKGGPVLAVSQN